jgi:dihydroxyacetone kinase
MRKNPAVTKLHDDPSRFGEDALEGFIDVFSESILGVRGGVVRATRSRPAKVAVVIGGGSGHYPAFCGLVGTGFADGAVVGNVFTSPSMEDAYSVARAADNGGGVLFSFGNYAGDVMNFGLAQQRLAKEGVEVRTVVVTDDVASAPADESERRRGIAGDFVVFKIAGAAAEAGFDLDAVEAIATRANQRTKTLGIAFGGCTLPGQLEPLFTVPDGQMAIGLGIHGEPGIEESPLPAAAALAKTLVDVVLGERPVGAGDRIAVVLNGLGSTKYEELFVVWKSVAALLRAAGHVIVEPEVGELVTSLDMAGCSLSVLFLDDELEALWRAPAITPAYKKGAAHVGAQPRVLRVPEAVAPTQPIAASAAARACARTSLLALSAIAEALVLSARELGDLDAIAGDGDHGRGMVKGSAAAVSAAGQVVDRGAGVAEALGVAGDAWAAAAGGTSGVLWGAALRRFGESLDGISGRTSLEEIVDAFRAGRDAIAELGKAHPGDKTMLDAIDPFIDELAREAQSGHDAAAAWTAASVVALAAAIATASLRPKVGRARPLAEKSVGAADPGATSFAIAMEAVAGVLRRAEKKESTR